MANEHDDDDEEEEGELASGIKFTNQPGVEEVRQHNLTHLPFRNWCPYRVQGEAVNMPHYNMHERKEVPTYRWIIWG